MSPIKVILNPIAGRGLGGRSEARLHRYLQEEQLDYDLVLTQGPGHAIELARQAAGDGFDTVVAAGGDGTTQEVVNGLMAAAGGGIAGTLGVIPVGSGSDFAHNVGVPADVQGACQRLARGESRIVDVCRVTVDDQPPTYFDNTVNVGFGGIVTVESRKVKWLRGMALYLPVVLKTVFLTEAPQMTIRYDDQEMTVQAHMVCVANGAREGGGFFCAPDARNDDGLLDVCIVGDIGRLAMLALVPRFISGTHVGHQCVTMGRTQQVTVTSDDALIAHADGEILCTDARQLAFEVLPQQLRVAC
jgi:YegS/Rv2252/BmrU family lipid kinase